MKEKADETNESALHFIERIHARGRAGRAPDLLKHRMPNNPMPVGPRLTNICDKPVSPESFKKRG
jgi:hypothetical protein